MNIVLLTSHSIAEYDDLRMLTDLGYSVFSIGAYTDPSSPSDNKRPALDAPYYADLADRAQESRRRHPDGAGDKIDWAKADLHEDIIDWADAIIVHHFPERWIADQWPRIAHKRVIWRTCGQSDPRLESVMGQFHDVGMQIVRYSPAEKRAFESVGSFAGQDALIRFGKYPADFEPWIGDNRAVGNITQDMAHRGDSCGYSFWLAATEGLPTEPAGPGSEAMGGLGALPYEVMLSYLRHLRVYLYTGTRPASYTLGLMEAMFAGVPTLTIGARAWGGSWNGSRLFEAATDADFLRGETASHILPLDSQFDVPADANEALRWFLDYDEKAAVVSKGIRQRAIELFDVATVGPQWVEFLGQP